MNSRVHVLLWADSTAACIDAIKAAGLAGRVVIDTSAGSLCPTCRHI